MDELVDFAGAAAKTSDGFGAVTPDAAFDVDEAGTVAAGGFVDPADDGPFEETFPAARPELRLAPIPEARTSPLPPEDVPDAPPAFDDVDVEGRVDSSDGTPASAAEMPVAADDTSPTLSGEAIAGRAIVDETTADVGTDEIFVAGAVFADGTEGKGVEELGRVDGMTAADTRPVADEEPDAGVGEEAVEEADGLANETVLAAASRRDQMVLDYTKLTPLRISIKRAGEEGHHLKDRRKDWICQVVFGRLSSFWDRVRV